MFTRTIRYVPHTGSPDWTRVAPCLSTLFPALLSLFPMHIDTSIPPRSSVIERRQVSISWPIGPSWEEEHRGANAKTREPRSLTQIMADLALLSEKRFFLIHAPQSKWGPGSDRAVPYQRGLDTAICVEQEHCPIERERERTIEKCRAQRVGGMERTFFLDVSVIE